MTAEYRNDRLNSNLRHDVFCIQAVAPEMVAAGNGSIVNKRQGTNSWTPQGEAGTTRDQATERRISAGSSP